jgi:anti-anti-sigma factor
MMLATEEVTPGVTKINLTGRLDIAGAQAIDLHFNALVGSQRAIIVDLAEVAFIASMGLRTLILGARTVASKRGRIVLYRPIPEVENVLVTSGTDTVVPIVHQLDDAIRAVSG